MNGRNYHPILTLIAAKYPELIMRIKEDRDMSDKWMEIFKEEIDQRVMEGRLAGLNEGRLAGLNEGRIAGLNEGRLAGLNEGRLAGLNEGRLAGLNEGRIAGLNEGRNEGQVQAYDNMIRKGLITDDQAAEALNMTVAGFREAVERLALGAQSVG